MPSEQLDWIFYFKNKTQFTPLAPVAKWARVAASIWCSPDVPVLPSLAVLLEDTSPGKLRLENRSLCMS